MPVRSHLLLPLASCLLISCGGSSGDGPTTGFGSTNNLDNSFSSDGKVTTPFTGGNNAIGSGDANAVSLQSDGKIVVAGAINQDFGIVRYKSDGSIDNSFGLSGNGIVTTNWSVNLNSQADSIAAMVQDSTGRFVVAGYSQVSGNFRFSVARYLSDGTPDHDFGFVGSATLQPESGADSSVNAITVQPSSPGATDGKVVLGGFSGVGGDTNKFALARFNTTGTIDTGFGTLGSSVFDLGGNDAIYALGVQTNGLILAAGVSTHTCVLARFHADGSQFDSSFGSTQTRINSLAGTVVVPFGGSDDCQLRSIAVQDDGKVVVAGYTITTTTSGTTSKFALARYDATGVLDGAFGVNGIATVDMGSNAEANAMAVQADGKFVLAGTAGGNFALVRFNANGMLDTSFASDGKSLADFGSGDVAKAVAIQPNGNIVAAGSSGNQFAVARYKP
ncbi:MAG: hypothetical protein ABI605_05805 [Rhizobacter sp.]